MIKKLRNEDETEKFKWVLRYGKFKKFATHISNQIKILKPEAKMIGFESALCKKLRGQSLHSKVNISRN